MEFGEKQRYKEGSLRSAETPPCEADPSVLPDLVVVCISVGRDFEADAMILVVVERVVGEVDVAVGVYLELVA
ncbi:MAG: hypothetical protein H0W79_01480 [Rubrobacteraceae bacterium]|nr:hypothetical protein [Rubrobacteraceae bacterium]